MQQLTLFTWGYYGWGNAVPQLIQAVDSVEFSRGYRPPVFVDIRVSRSVRAPGFNGNAFGKSIGESRYLWMDDLGNEQITKGGQFRIKNPKAAEVLLNKALEHATKNERILFFCACEYPGNEEDMSCHRVRVATHVLEAAERKGVPVRVEEWPGGEPQPGFHEIVVSDQALEKVRRGSNSLVLDDSVAPPTLAGLPWMSPVRVQLKGTSSDPDSSIFVLSGPARFRKGNWYLPIYDDISNRTAEEIRVRINQVRSVNGFAPRFSKS